MLKDFPHTLGNHSQSAFPCTLPFCSLVRLLLPLCLSIFNRCAAVLNPHQGGADCGVTRCQPCSILLSSIYYSHHYCSSAMIQYTSPGPFVSKTSAKLPRRPCLRLTCLGPPRVPRWRIVPWPITRFCIFIYGSFTFNDLNDQPVLLRTRINVLVHSIASRLIVTKPCSWLDGAYRTCIPQLLFTWFLPRLDTTCQRHLPRTARMGGDEGFVPFGGEGSFDTAGC